MPNGDKVTAARPMFAGERANKALHLTPENVAKIRDYIHFSRVAQPVLWSWGAGELERWTAFNFIDAWVVSRHRLARPPFPWYATGAQALRWRSCHVSNDAPFSFFRGPCRCLITSLSVSECLRKVQTEIAEPTLPVRKWLGWFPLRGTPRIWRKMRKHDVLFLTDSADRGREWLFYSQFIAHGSGTMIRGQYRTPTAVWGLVLVVTLYGMYLVVSSYLGVPVLLVGRRTGGIRPLPFGEAVFLAISLPLAIVTLIVMHTVRRRTHHRVEEQEIVLTLKQLLNAEDAPQPGGRLELAVQQITAGDACERGQD